MKLKEVKEPEKPGKKKAPGTRADRANEHAVMRQKNRHAERDYFGRVVPEPGSLRPDLTPAAAKRAAEGTVRLDAYLAGRGLAPSRDKAKLLIESGRVRVNGSARVKASLAVGPEDRVEVLEEAAGE